MPQSQVSLRTVFTICAGVLISGAAAYALWRAQLALTFVILAAILAIALEHGVDLLTRHRVPRGAAIAIVVATFLGAAAAVGVFIGGPAVAQFEALAKSLPDLLAKIHETEVYKTIAARVGDADLVDKVGQVGPGVLLGALNTVVGLVGAAVSIFLLAVFMLIFGGSLVTSWLGGLADDRRERFGRVLTDIHRAVGGYVAGVVFISACNGVATAIFLGILHMPFFLPLALASAIACMIPYVGELVMCVVVAAIALATLGQWQSIACVVYFITYGQIEGSIINPTVFRRTVHVNPLVTLMAVLFLGQIAGLVGAFLAIPVVATAQIVLREARRAAAVVSTE